MASSAQLVPAIAVWDYVTNAGATLSSASVSGAATAGSLSIGSGTTLTYVAAYSASFATGGMAASIGAQEFTYALAGLATTDKIVVNGPTPGANTAFVSARVPSNGNIAMTWMNNTAAANTPASGPYTILAFRS